MYYTASGIVTLCRWRSGGQLRTGRIARITRSNPAEGTDVRRLCLCVAGSGLCDEPINRPEESYRVRVCVCVYL